jgi:EAL domain-containing protein (putative c-di-GMP-specific phosphodiesterase class I)
LLQVSQLDPGFFKFEIVESLIREDEAEGVSRQLWELQNLGISLSIDDFGTGYSSLSRLHSYPINTLKIDRSFTTRIGSEGESSEMVQIIITLAHSLGMDVVAEGVETQEQLHVIQRLGYG